MTNKVFCWNCKHLTKNIKYCEKKKRTVNTCMKKCEDYEVL